MRVAKAIALETRGTIIRAQPPHSALRASRALQSIKLARETLPMLPIALTIYANAPLVSSAEEGLPSAYAFFQVGCAVQRCHIFPIEYL